MLAWCVHLLSSFSLCVLSCDLSALSRSATILLGSGHDGQTLLSWLQSQQRDWLDSSTLSDLDSTVTAKELASNVEMLLALESDIEAVDRLWSGRRALDVAEIVVG